MWLPDNIVATVERAAHVYYVDKRLCKEWNTNRREGELRLLTGWAWSARGSGIYRQGFKTKTVAIRDAYYSVIVGIRAPALRRPKLRLVTDRRSA